MTTLENSYCVPRTVEEWVECVPWMFEDELLHYVVGRPYLASGSMIIEKEPREGTTEIPVSRFLDLLNDRIVPWRLEEVGFSKLVDGYQRVELDDCSIHVFDGGISPKIYVMPTGDFSEDIKVHITTFTDLLTLIRMLTPPSND